MSSKEYYDWLQKFEKRNASDDKAKELQTKELQIKNNLINWELSDREWAIVESLGLNND